MGGYNTNTANREEKAILIGLIHAAQNEKQVKEYLDELEFLAYTAIAKTVKRFIQRLEAPNPKTFIGSGKIKEVKKFIDLQDIDMVIFDDELSPTQLRNIERIINPIPNKPTCKILDRNNLILDIFAKRARTAHAKNQVALAQYQYILPRLTRMWTHLERQKGGIGLRGPGETELETDRRIIREKIKRLKDKLSIIDKQKATQRKSRGQMIRVALVGYTNVGKSTLMNRLTKTDVFAENKLFATLDTTVRKMTIGNLPFLLSDTVGFIRKLPHQLIKSFKSTLDEVKEADVLLHLADISHPSFEDQIRVVNQTLQEINSNNIPTIIVFNKVDLYTGDRSVKKLKNTWMGKLHKSTVGKIDNVVFISATEKTGIEELKNALYKIVRPLHVKRYPYNNLLY